MISYSAYLEHELVFGEALHRLQEVGTERQGVAGLRLAPPQHRRGVLLPAQLVDGPDAKLKKAFVRDHWRYILLSRIQAGPGRKVGKSRKRLLR